jgi:hypothetical protein
MKKIASIYKKISPPAASFVAILKGQKIKKIASTSKKNSPPAAFFCSCLKRSKHKEDMLSALAGRLCGENHVLWLARRWVS